MDCCRWSLPLPVLLNRLAAVLLVFIFGMGLIFDVGRFSGRVGGRDQALGVSVLTAAG